MGLAIERRMLEALPVGHPLPELREYYRLLRDYPLRGGKRLRGRLLLLSAAAHGAGWQAGLTVAAALELFQNWVLVHDDLEDDSEERRGRPALHREAGLPVAVNAGDGLHVYMWDLLLSEPELPRRLLREFTWMIHRTAEGQHIDLSWVRQGRFDVTEADYLEMVRLKTAYYTVVCPLRLGAMVAGREPAAALSEAGESLGAAFQIRDDVLNLLAESPGYGKERAGDLLEGKRTLILARFFQLASDAERREAMERLARPRARKSPQDVARLLALVERHGAVEYAQRFAEARAAAGLERLEGALAELPGRAAAAEIARLLRSLTERTA